MISAFVITIAILAFISTLSINPSLGVSATASSNNHLFIETFDVDSAEDSLFDSTSSSSSGRWKKSKAGKYANQAVQVAVPAASVDGFENDKALILDVGNKHYGIFHEFSSPIVATKGKDLIIQYEVRLEEQHNCGGAYLKFPRAQSGVSLANLDNDTPYSIMFGPDKCGSTNKVHFIVQVQNPVTKKWNEHHLKEVLSMANDKRTHLYGVHIKPNGSFDLYLDNKVSK
jgi:calnexin